jgi:hypothetical protein
MDHKDIESQLDAVVAKLTEKGYERPEAYFQINSGGDHFSHITARINGEALTDGEFGESPTAAIKRFQKWADGLEKVEVQRQREAVKKFGKAIDALRDSGIAADFTDPLAEHLQAMSKGLITHEAAE